MFLLKLYWVLILYISLNVIHILPLDENDIVADHNVENHEQAPVEGVDLLEAGGSDDLFNVGELQDLSYDANTSFSYIKDVDDIGYVLYISCLL